jgi:AcrR family transcriptional regulator
VVPQLKDSFLGSLQTALAPTVIKKERSLYFGAMPRVSQEHSEARRRQILAGARRCFAENGFHAPSMQDLLNEIGLSPGAFYRYFASKEELIATIAREALSAATSTLTAYLRPEDPPPLAELLGGLPTASLAPLQDPELSRLVIQVWAESMRDDALRKVVQDGLLRMSALLTEIVTTHQGRGELPADLDPKACARVVVSALQGYMIQRSAFGIDDPELFSRGLRSLFREERDPAVPDTA